MKTIEELLADLKALNERADGGEDVKAEREKVVAELREKGFVPAADAEPQETELERLRRQEAERAEADIAARAAQEAIKSIQTEEAQRNERIAQTAAEAVKQAMGGTADVGTAVKAALEATRGGSRFAAEGADQSLVEHLAKGGSIDDFGRQEPGNVGRIEVGENRGVKGIKERKSLAEFMSIIARSKRAGALNDSEMLFLRESQSKAMAQGTDTAGGFAVLPEWMPDILKVLRAQAIVRRAGGRIIPFNKQMNQISISSGTAAFYTAETARITPSELTLAQAAVLTPHYLTALVPVSNVLLGNWQAAEESIRDDVVAAISTREDLAFLQGLGSGGEPVGFRNIAGIITNPLAPGANGFNATLPQLRQIRGRTRLAGLQNPQWTWFFHPALLTYLETLTDTLGRFLVDAGLLRINDDGISGVFDGHPFYASYQIPTTLTLGTSTNVSYVLLVDMNNVLIGDEQSLTLDTSSEASFSPDGGVTNYSAFQQNETLFRAILGHDINHRRPSVGIIDQEGVKIS